MAQDIKELLKKDTKLNLETMPSGHENRFQKRLELELPEDKKESWSWLNIAASVVIVLGLSFGMYSYFDTTVVNTSVVEVEQPKTITKTLGDVSPGLKKVEDYYLANINLELSKVKLTPENKDLIDGYIKQLDELNKEYQRLSVELTNSGPKELTVNALITNLKFRLNLMYRLKEQLKIINDEESNQNRTV